MATYGGIDMFGVLSIADNYGTLVKEDGDYQDSRSCLEQAIRTLLFEAISAEREACAKVCEDLWKQEADDAASGTQDTKYHDAIECAYAIRARSNTP
jgi:hypothetical protein